MSFTSDFSLFPIKKLGIPGWEYKKATWAPEIDKKVHQLFDGSIDENITYKRKRNFDGKEQECEIVKKGTMTFIMKPGDGYNYLIKRNSYKNNKDKKDGEDDDIPHDLLCLICQDSKRSYSLECGHVVSCAECADLLFQGPKKCPICRKQFYNKPTRLYF